jgi:hypothetical protein
MLCEFWGTTFCFNMLKQFLFHLQSIHVLYLSNDIRHTHVSTIYYILLNLKYSDPKSVNFPFTFWQCLFILSSSSMLASLLHIGMLICYVYIVCIHGVTVTHRNMFTRLESTMSSIMLYIMYVYLCIYYT